ncbi:HmuY family protein [Teredinibacter turnerae]|uniref:HmuY family protein n=1 Tax=Teredinibacter turnerae TaxID=2426 RepID=UPI0005F7ACA2|nr:HmuY family protein [Teredinibacter turnerae]
MKYVQHVFAIAIANGFLSACGGSSGNESPVTPTPEPTPAPTPAPTFQVIETAGLETGSSSAPVTVYYDIDNAAIVDINEQDASSNSAWDIAFRRTKVYLNTHAENTVKIYFTENTDGFYDDDGNPILESFINADYDTELALFEAFTGEVPADAEFHSDSTEPGIEGFYSYSGSPNHELTANDTAYYIVDSDDVYTKFRVTDIAGATQEGYASVTFELATAAGLDIEFGNTSDLTVDVSACMGNIYVDLGAAVEVSADGDWDLMLPCADGLAEYAIDIAGDARVMSGEYGELDTIESASINYYPWVNNVNEIRAIVEYGDTNSNYGWAEYGVNGGHSMWPNFAIYIVDTATARYKFQIISYYDSETSASGSFTVRHQQVHVD